MRRSFEQAHRELLADRTIQFSMEPYRPDPPPAWLQWLIDNFGAVWPVLRVVLWAGLAALAAFLLYKLARRLAGERWPWRRDPRIVETDGWRPQEGSARALLAEADRLAAAGRYDEAAHLLLFRSIEDIEARRPRLVRPALTSREVALAPDLPDEPRRAFQSIVREVERSLFGGRSLLRQDWDNCRAAYERFAFAGAWTR